jgi:hypothetical protein
VSVPATAAPTLPPTGASSNDTVRGRRAAIPRTSSGPIVDICTTTAPGGAAATAELESLGPNSAASTAAPSVSIVITRSAPATASAGVAVIPARSAASGAVLAGVRFHTVTR